MIHHTAQGLASLGRHGDTMLVHMSPHEVAGLNYLAKKQGTKLTINPETGLPEAFSLGGFFSSFLPTIAGMMVPGSWGAMAPILAGAATGAGLAAVKKEDPLMGGLMGGLGGWSGAKLGPAIGAANTPTVATTLPANTFGGLTQSADLATKAVEDAAIQSGMKAGANLPIDAGQKAILDNIAATRSASTIPQIGMANTFGQTASAATLPQTTGQSIFGGLKNIATGQPGAWDAFKAAGGTGTQLAMTGAGAVLGGLEPSDLYGNPAKPSDKDKYDPYATLNLNQDTGLRLLAGGGAIYDDSDNTPPPNLSQDGFGVGRLNNLAAQQAKTQAETYGYAGGGAIAFADGGDPTDKVNTDLALPEPSQGIAALPAAQPTEQGPTPEQVATAASAPPTGGSIIEQVAGKLQQDPNYQPQNPIEAAIVKQLKGTDNMGQEQQGLGSLGPSQPMAPTFNASQPMAPTYFAGLNAPKGYDRGGYLDGQGDGMSDSIPATIEGKQPARLADGEFVVPADVVSHIGNGSSKAGSKRLYKMLDKVRQARTGTKKQGREINPNKYLPA